jgi:RNA polymerase sigma factor (sigma-70 family)
MYPDEPPTEPVDLVAFNCIRCGNFLTADPEDDDTPCPSGPTTSTTATGEPNTTTAPLLQRYGIAVTADAIAHALRDIQDQAAAVTAGGLAQRPPRSTAPQSDDEENSMTNPLDELYRSYHYQLLHYAARWIRSHHDAEDAVHDAFEYALGAFATIQTDNPRAWMFTITRYRAIEARHRQTSTALAGNAIEGTPEPPTEPAPTDPDAPTMADPNTALYVLAALDELAPRQREAIALWAFEGLSWQQVATRMGIKPASVKRGTLRSLNQLRDR